MVESVSSVAVVIGPTAAGKTAAAMALQDLLGGPAKHSLSVQIRRWSTAVWTLVPPNPAPRSCMTTPPAHRYSRPQRAILRRGLRARC